MIRLLTFLLLFPFLGLTACQRHNKTAPVITDPVFPSDSQRVADCRRCIVITDQAESAIDIVDVGRQGQIVWSWRPDASNMDADKLRWFSNPDDAKPVYGSKYLLINASGGGVALVRIVDHKVVFYAHAGKNPHSSEVLPDGNIVTASSTDNRLVIFHADTTVTPESVYRKVIPLPFAHNVVWDKRRKILWSAGGDYLYAFQYNFNCRHPDLIKKDSFQLPGDEAHDLFPVYGKDSLWLTNPYGVYTIDLKTKDITAVRFNQTENIKSVSSGPQGWPVITMKPETQWWSDKVLDSQGEVLFRQSGMKIYKARWFLPNAFSYDDDEQLAFCP